LQRESEGLFLGILRVGGPGVRAVRPTFAPTGAGKGGLDVGGKKYKVKVIAYDTKSWGRVSDPV